MPKSRFRPYIIVIALLAAFAISSQPLAADTTAANVDSQSSLQRNIAPPAGPDASKYSAAVEKLLQRMTLKEKVGQMTQLAIGMITDGRDETIKINPEKLHKAVVEYGVGSFLNVQDQAMSPEKWQETLRAIDAEVKKSRLKIPSIYGIDTIHGANYVDGATLFPQPLGMAATWNPDVMLRGSQIAAAETRKAGIPWVFSPVLDAGRQLLWPRLWETFGEDTYLATVMGVATVRGYEGADISNPDHVASSLKHYVGYSFPTTGGDRSPALIPEITLREYFLPAFAAAVKAGAHTVMVNSSEVNGIPGHANAYLLKTVLRDELGFKGIVVSDWEDIKKLVRVHHIAADEKEATRISVLAGVDMSMVPSDYSFSDLLLQLVNEGKVPQSRIDEAVRRVLMLKYQLGLFEDPLRGVDQKISVASLESQKVALESVHESITLLKNDNHALPLSKTAHILVAGPNSDSMIPLNNGWSFTWQGEQASSHAADYLTIHQAIEQKIGAKNLTFVPPSSEAEKAALAAASADAIVLCLGEWAYAETPGNVRDLTLPEEQIRLAQKMLETKKPVIVVLTEGRPRIIRVIVDGAAAIVMAYNPGNKGGQAIADILFGDVNPSGKLPLTYPRWPDKLFTYDHKTFEGEDGQVVADDLPQFEFGYGLSYTKFEYSDLRVSPQSASGGPKIQVSVTVKNTGDRAGKEVVQVYLSQRFASITPPLKRLKRFAKISLQPDESHRFTFELDRDDLSFIGADNKRIVEPGAFDVRVGNLKQTFQWK
jgi:beta-glucosidase